MDEIIFFSSVKEIVLDFNKDIISDIKSFIVSDVKKDLVTEDKIISDDKNIAVEEKTDKEDDFY